MVFVPMGELLAKAAAERYAVPSFDAWNAEAMLAVLSVAADMRAPVILMNGQAEYGVLPAAPMGAVAHTLARRFAIPAAFHLDHGDGIEVVRDALEAGYTSVMLDFSRRPYAENVQAMRQVVALARPRGVTVEGELGHVGRADDNTIEGMAASTLTEAAEAAAFVRETGIDALAVSIGNAHGQYTELPQLDFGRLAEIRAAVPIPLVLHGGSGTPEDDLRCAIAGGIAKINVATELMAAVRRGWVEVKDERLWYPMALAKAMRAVPPVVEKWIRWCGAAGKA